MSLLESLRNAQQETRAADEAAYKAVILRSGNPEPSDGAALAELVGRLGYDLERVERDLAAVERLGRFEADLAEIMAAESRFTELEAEHQKLRGEWRKLQAAFDEKHADLRQRLGAAQLAANRAHVRPERLEAARARVAEHRKARADLFG